MHQEGAAEYSPGPKAISDPFEYFDKWRSSSNYGEAINKYFVGKKLAGDVTEDEKKEVFEESYEAKKSMLDFSKREDGQFVYDSSKYPLDVAEKMGSYIDSVRYVMKRMGEGVDRDDVKQLDGYRSFVHGEVTQALIKAGIAPNVKMGRTFARLVLISKGLDTYETAGRKDVDRIWGVMD